MINGKVVGHVSLPRLTGKKCRLVGLRDNGLKTTTYELAKRKPLRTCLKNCRPAQIFW